MVSATSFTLVGVVNKFLTVLLNVLAWEKHSTPFGIFAVCLCLGAGFFYQQAPRRDMTRKLEVKKGEAVDAEKEELLPTREEEGKATHK
jgi:GDP-mannose transporter